MTLLAPKQMKEYFKLSFIAAIGMTVVLQFVLVNTLSLFYSETMRAVYDAIYGPAHMVMFIVRVMITGHPDISAWYLIIPFTIIFCLYNYIIVLAAWGAVKIVKDFIKSANVNTREQVKTAQYRKFVRFLFLSSLVTVTALYCSAIVYGFIENTKIAVLLISSYEVTCLALLAFLFGKSIKNECPHCVYVFPCFFFVYLHGLLRNFIAVAGL